MQIRADLTASQDEVWNRLSLAGTWLTGDERVNVAREVRGVADCELCKERKAALAPNTVQGEHLESAPMPASRRELIHKLVSDPGRIARAWVDTLLAEMTDTEYVEVAGLVSAILVVDTFHAALGMPLRDLPTPQPGTPNRQRPLTAADEGAYVPMVPVDGLQGDYADLYDLPNWVPNVHRAFSLVPAATRTADVLMQTHYFPYEVVPRYTDADHEYAINKMQMELLASRVSLHNDCFY